MISDPTGRWIVSTQRYIDPGTAWCFDSHSREVTPIPLNDATRIEVSAGAGELFTALHRFNGERLLLTVQSYSDPGRPVSWIDVRGWSPVICGDTTAWVGLTRAYVAYLNEDAMGVWGYFLIRVSSEGVLL
jgi:hypothetical protein